MPPSSRYSRTNASPSRSTTHSGQTIGQTRINIVKRLAIEGKAERGPDGKADGASIRMYLRVSRVLVCAPWPRSDSAPCSRRYRYLCLWTPSYLGAPSRYFQVSLRRIRPRSTRFLEPRNRSPQADLASCRGQSQDIGFSRPPTGQQCGTIQLLFYNLSPPSQGSAGVEPPWSLKRVVSVLVRFDGLFFEFPDLVLVEYTSIGRQIYGSRTREPVPSLLRTPQGVST